MIGKALQLLNKWARVLQLPSTSSAQCWFISRVDPCWIHGQSHTRKDSAITKLKSVLQCKDMLGAYWGCRDHSLLLNFRILVLVTLILSSCGVLRILGVKNKLIKTISTMWHRTHRDPPAGSCWGPAGWCSQVHADWHRNWWQRITEPWTKGGWKDLRRPRGLTHHTRQG